MGLKLIFFFKLSFSNPPRVRPHIACVRSPSQHILCKTIPASTYATQCSVSRAACSLLITYLKNAKVNSGQYIILTFCIYSKLQIRSTVSTTNLTDVEAEKPKEKKFLPNIEKWQMVILVTVFALIINIVAIYLFGTFFESRYRRGLEKGRILIVTGVMSDV